MSGFLAAFRRQRIAHERNEDIADPRTVGRGRGGASRGDENHGSSLRSSPNYLVWIAPLVGLNLVIPTISGDGILQHAGFKLPFLRTTADVLSLAHRKDRPWWTRFSHVFVHFNIDHLSTNMLALVMEGFAVYQEAGGLGLWATFMLGGVGATLDPLKHEFRQWQTQMRHTVGDLVPTGILERLTSSDTMGSFFGALVGLPRDNKYCCGASGGIYALVGFSTASCLHHFCRVVISSALWGGSVPDEQLVPMLAMSVGHRLATIACDFGAIYDVDLGSTRARRIGNDLVGHHAHLDGALCGVAIWMIFRFTRWLL